MIHTIRHNLLGFHVLIVLYEKMSQESRVHLYTFHFDTITGGSATTYSSTSVVFGCTNYRSRKLAEYTTVDGILGLGRMPLSIISQLSSPGIIPNVFSHCLRGDNGSGILVLGEIMELGIIYTPLVPSRRPAYNVNLQSIALNGEVVKINPVVFGAESGTIVDSGTTFVVFAEKAYDPFINSLISFVLQFALPVLHTSTQCFQVFNRAHDNIPRVSFNFEGGASMTLEPKDYLLWNVHDDIDIWCTDFQKGHDKSMNIIGEIMLKDKIVVYDLSRQRVAWVKYNCSQSTNVSQTDTYERRPWSSSSLKVETRLTSILATSAALLLYLSLFG